MVEGLWELGKFVWRGMVHHRVMEPGLFIELRAQENPTNFVVGCQLQFAKCSKVYRHFVAPTLATCTNARLVSHVFPGQSSGHYLFNFSPVSLQNA